MALFLGLDGSALFFHFGNFCFDPLDGFRVVHLFFLAGKLLLEFRQLFANNFQLFFVFLVQCHVVVSSCSQPLGMRLSYRYTLIAQRGLYARTAHQPVPSDEALGS